ncbi:MAG: hypothetical protein JXR83_05290 [Deltaproteobacteria bacterium]|nr:hypothetical protein [Deltaproteobacteria bacterium]
MANRIGQAPVFPIGVPVNAPQATGSAAAQAGSVNAPLTEQQVAQRTGLAAQQQAVQNFAQGGEHQVAPKKLGLLNLLQRVGGGPADWGRVPAEARTAQLLQLAQQARAQAGSGGTVDVDRDPMLSALAKDMGWQKPFSFEEVLFLLQMKYAAKQEQELLAKMNELAK